MTRDSYFDILRGIAILLVIAIHTYPGGDFETAEGFVNICLRECCNVAVPLFLAISGYFIGKKDLSTRGKYISFPWCSLCTWGANLSFVFSFFDEARIPFQFSY